MGKAVGDLGSALTAALVVIGDKLGLYKALAAAGPLTPAELARNTGTAERYVREWLNAQAAAGYATYDAGSGRYYLLPEQASALADEDSPAFVLGGFQAMTAAMKAEPKLAEAFRTGSGVGWHEHDPTLFEGTERFFRPGYRANLVNSWIPALDGVEAKLKAGAKVADVGCGHGTSTILLGQAYPNSTIVGFDYHKPSITRARQVAREAGVDDHVRFEVAAAKEFPERGLRSGCVFRLLARHGRSGWRGGPRALDLGDDGTWMIVEPFASDRVEDNLNPVGRVFYSASTLICTPASLAQEVGMALGAQAGESRLREVVMAGGFHHFRRATQTPFNLVLEARP